MKTLNLITKAQSAFVILGIALMLMTVCGLAQARPHHHRVKCDSTVIPSPSSPTNIIVLHERINCSRSRDLNRRTMSLVNSVSEARPQGPSVTIEELDQFARRSAKELGIRVLLVYVPKGH